MLHPNQVDAIADAVANSVANAVTNVLRKALLGATVPIENAAPLNGMPAEVNPAVPATDSARDVSRLPEFSVVGREQAATILGVSIETLKRLEARGKGPKRIRVSLKRVGYRLSDLRAWVEARTAA
jgi:predicted DNA-binding transcriptional regulator AlpA